MRNTIDITCSSTQWNRIVYKLEEHVTDLAEWSFGKVRQFKCLETLHDYSNGKIASPIEIKGPGHNWSGTYGGTEADMLDELLWKAKEDGLVVQEVVTHFHF